MTSIALNVSIVLSSAAMALGYGLAALWLQAAVMFVLGALWMLGQRANWPWIGWLMLALFASAAVMGTWFELNPALFVIGLIAALSAWTLDNFARQLEEADSVEGEQALKRSHLRRLLLVDGLGLLSTVLALSIQIRLSFALAVVLGLVVLVALSHAIGFLRREGG